jgi:gamma-glutamylcyclotransferase (GGCT)/AIG2-like uncharacterized protein YtfP
VGIPHTGSTEGKKGLTDMNETERLFVYGSLKRGLHNFSVLRNAEGTYAGDAILPNAKMWSLGPYPAVTLGGNQEETVSGEMFDVPTGNMRRLDAFEGHPNYYKRTSTTVTDTHGFTHKVWVYEFVRQEQLTGAPQVLDGNWTMLRSH